MSVASGNGLLGALGAKTPTNFKLRKRCRWFADGSEIRAELEARTQEQGPQNDSHRSADRRVYTCMGTSAHVGVAQQCEMEIARRERTESV